MRNKPIILTPSIVTRFWTKVDQISSPHGCWLWTGTRQSKGYGILHLPPQTLAHRVSYQIRFGSIPPDLYVLHNCPGADNPLCINPDHLWIGTLDDNNRDMRNKGRGRTPFQHGHSLAVGQKNAHSKLTDTAVRAIRFEFSQGQTTYRELAQQYEVSTGAIYDTIKRRTWGHIE